MVEVRQLNDFELYLYSPEGQFLGVIRNDTQLLDVLLQIREENKEGYYAIDASNGKRLFIYEYVRIENGFDSLHEKLLTELVGF